MKKTVCVIAAVVAVGLLLLGAKSGVGGRTQPAGAQSGNIVVKETLRGEPVEVSKLQVGGRDVTFGGSFVGDENWANALSCMVKNTSGKVIAELRMHVSFETNKGKRVAIPLTFLEPIQSDQTATMSAAPVNLASLRESLRRQGATVNLRRGELRVQYVKFADGSVWVRGATLSPRDGQTGKRKRA